MQFKNPIPIENGIDCDIDHPDWGWIPITLRPDDEPTSAMYWEVRAWLDSHPVGVIDE